jgi:hypothetical protein
MWRHTLKGYKLVHNPYLYNKHTKRCTGGTILAINTTTYSSIEPYQTPSHLQHHIATALLTKKAGSKIIAISLYIPQHNTTQVNKTYNEVLHWINKTLTKDLPHAAVILGGDLQATPSVGHPLTQSSTRPLLHLHRPQTSRRPLHTYLYTHKLTTRPLAPPPPHTHIRHHLRQRTHNSKKHHIQRPQSSHCQHTTSR